MEIFYTVLFILILMLLSYFIGSIPTAKIIGNIHGIDITKEGSKNSGGTNVGRVIGKNEGILTMVIDCFKCYIPCMITFLILNYAPLNIIKFENYKELYTAIVALFIAIGHSFSIFLHFKGGKCVACSLGYVLYSSPILALLCLIIFLIIVKISKRVSVGSLITGPICLLLSLIPMILDLTILKEEYEYNGGFYFTSTCLNHLTYITTITMLILVAFVTIRHKANILRLEKGIEPETHFKHNKKSK